MTVMGTKTETIKINESPLKKRLGKIPPANHRNSRSTQQLELREAESNICPICQNIQRVSEMKILAIQYVDSSQK